jgi:hypothetical protein
VSCCPAASGTGHLGSAAGSHGSGPLAMPDVAATMGVMGRSIGVVASTYGYDVGLPDEEFFALGVMSLASASTLSGKTAAMASLSRLTQQMMRRAAWAQLRRHWLANAIEQSYKALGFTLTKKKLAQAEPQLTRAGGAPVTMAA